MKKNISPEPLPDLIDSQYKIFFELTEQGFCLVEQIPGPDDHLTDYRYLAVNPSFQKQIGIPDVIGQTFRGTTPEGKLTVLEHYDKVVATGKPLNFEEWVPEMKVWIQAEVFPTKTTGQIAILFNNVTARKTAETELRNREEHLRTLTRLVPALLWEADTKGQKIELTERWCDYTGQTFEETQNWGWLHPIHPEGLPNTEKLFAQAFATGKAIELEERIRAADGEYRWFQVQHQPILDKKGKVSKWFGAAIDIQERKVAEEALQKKEDTLSIVLKGIGECFYALDKNFCFLFASKSALKMWGKEPSEIIGNKFLDSFPEAKGTEPFKAHVRVMATKVAERLEHISPVLNHWIEYQITSTDQDGLSVTFWDIEKRKQAETALRESEGRLKTVLNGIGEAFYVLDKDFRFLFASKAALKIWDKRPQEVIGHNFLKIFPEAEGAASFTAHLKVMETKVPVSLETVSPILHHWIEVQIAPTEQGGLSISFWNIEERKKAEQALRESEEKYRTLFESIDEGFHIIELIYDTNGKPVDYIYLEANNAFLTQTGLSDVTGKLGSVASPGTEQYWFERYDHVVKTGETTSFENYNSFTHRWYEGSASRVDKTGSHKVAVVFNDITERKKEEERQTFILKLSDTLRAETGVTAVGNRAAQMIAAKLKADRVYFVTLTTGTDEVIITHDARREDMPPLLGSYRSSDFPSAMNEIFERTIVYQDINTDPRLTDLDRLSLAGLGAVGFIAAPIRKGSEAMIWAAGALTTEPRKWAAADIAMFEDAIERTWAAIERTKADEALRESELRLAAVFDVAPIGLALADASGKILRFNNSLYNIWGIPPIPDSTADYAEWKGSWADTGELLTANDWAMAKTLHTGVTVPGDVIDIERFDGSYATIINASAPIWDAAGNIAGGVVAEIDITARRQAEKAIREREEQQQYLLKLSDALRPLSGPVEIQQTAVKTLGEHLKVNRAFYGEVMDDGDTLVIGPGYAKNVFPIEGRIKFTDFDPDLPEYYRMGQTVALYSVDDDMSNSEETRASLKSIDVYAAIGVPLLKNGKLCSILSLHQSKPRNWTATEISLVEETAERTWAAVERAKAEAALRESEIRRKIAMDAFEIGMLVWYPLEDRSEPDERLLQLYGLNPGDVITKSLVLSKIIHPEDRDYYARLVSRAIDPRSGGNLYAEIRVVHPDGSLHWLMITGQTIFEGKPLKPARMYGLAWDITAKKEVEEALKESETKYLSKLENRVASRTAQLQESRDRLQSIFDTTLIQMSILEAIRDKKGRIIDFEIKSVNKELERVTGRKDLIGKRYLQEYPGVKKVGIFEMIVKTIETGEPQQKEYFYAYEGFKQWFSCMFVKIADGVVATNTDITARKQAEETIRKMDAEQQRQIFQASLSTLEEERHRISESLHNGLGQLLYGVKLSLSNLKKETADHDFSNTKNYTEKLLTDAIKENRRISHELMPVVLEEFGLKLAVEDICNQFSDGTQFNCAVKTGKTRLEKYLELAVYRTIQELMINVVKHAEATEASVKIEIKQNQVLMNVTDNGQGINKQEGRKNGIGLKSIRSKIKLLNGSVRIRSKKGKGTEVEVIIPLTETQE